jgi:rhamnose transport system permease protein
MPQKTHTAAGIFQGRNLVRFKEFGVMATTLIAFAVVAIIEPRFLMYDNLRSVMLYIPLIVVVAMGEMMVILTGNIDLSLGSILGFSGMTVGLLFIRIEDFPIFPAFLLGTLVGIGLGLFNGLLVSKLRLPAIIVTLGTLNAFRGLLFIISGGIQIDPNYIPEKLIRLSQTSPIVIPWIVLFALIIAGLTHLFMRYAHFGREVYAYGSNVSAARLRGINMDKIVILTYGFAGGCAGFAGIMYASRFGYVNPGMTGVGFEFTVIAATVIGGVTVTGGSGSVLGVVIGCILLGIVNTALAVLGISAFWQQALYGFIIILALIVDKLLQNRVGSLEKTMQKA